MSFFYSNCNYICPVIIKRLKDVQDQFSNEERLKILSFSITPMIDTTDVLKQYEINHEINGQQWHLLTGSIDDVIQLARFSFLGNLNEEGYSFKYSYGNCIFSGFKPSNSRYL